MGTRSTRLLSAGLMLAGLGLASACSVSPAAVAPAAAPPAAVSVPSTQSEPAPLPVIVKVDGGGTAQVHHKAPSTHMSAPPKKSDDEGAAVNCGMVGPAGGKQVDLMADPTPAGTVGCTEAIDVITQYYHDAAQQVAGDGTARIRKIGKWTCGIDTSEPVSKQQIGCESTDGLSMYTQP